MVCVCYFNFWTESIDVILTTKGIAAHNPGVLFGYSEFENKYVLAASTRTHNWEIRLPEFPLGWQHVGITWSKQWGLRFYQNGSLTADSSNPVRIRYEFGDKFTLFLIGRDSSDSPLPRRFHLQIADLRIWESVIPQQRMVAVLSKAGDLFLSTGLHSFIFPLCLFVCFFVFFVCLFFFNYA